MDEVESPSAEKESDTWSGLSFPVARTPDGALAWASRDLARQTYQCVGCESAMQLRAGAKVRAHFAHVPGERPCAPETALHIAAKQTVADALRFALERKTPYHVRYKCDECGRDHDGNLALGPRIVSVEKPFEKVRPDILIETEGGKPLVAIEIVVTHTPDSAALEIYAAARLPVLIVHPTVGSLTKLRHALGKVQAIGAPCRRERCRTCRSFIETRTLHTIPGYNCYHCGEAMLIIEHFDTESGPELSFALTRSIIPLAKSLGVKLESRYSKGIGRYPQHICANCNRGQGAFHVRQWRHNFIDRDDQVVIATAAFRHCEQCDRWDSTDKTDASPRTQFTDG